MAHRGLPIEPLERRVLLSAEPTLVQPMANQPLYSNAGQSEAVGLGTLRFYLGDNNSIWRTDGTAAGTYTLGTGSHLTAFNSSVYFVDTDGALWRTSGTVASTTQIFKTTLNSGRYPFFSHQALFVADGKLIAILDDNQFFEYDGNSAPTKSSGDYQLDDQEQYVVTHDAVFMLSRTYPSGDVYRLDLTHNSVTELFQDNSTTQIADAGDTLYLSRTDFTIWTVDSTGTLKQLTSGPLFDSFNDTGALPFAINGIVYFSRHDPTDPTRSVLWRMPSGQSPTQVATFQGGLDLLANFNNKLVLSALGDQQLWVTDGTAAGTTELHDGFTPPDTLSTSIVPTFGEFTTIGSHLLFVADAGGAEVWETDGTAAGTILHDIVHHHASVFDGSQPGGLSAIDGTLYFSANGGDKVGAGLWSMVVAPPTLNQAPTADAGGPYSIREGKSITFNATATDPDADTLTYQWDINGDGAFGDASGASPHLTWNQLRHLGIKDGPRTFHPRVQVSDGHTNVTSGRATFTIKNTAPSLAIGGGPGPTADAVYTLPLVASDPGADIVSEWDINWGDGSPIEPWRGGIGGSRSSARHVYASPGTYTLNATASDDDGSYIVAPATVTVRAAQPVGVAAVDRFNAAFGGATTSPSQVVSAGGVTYFTGTDDAGNAELWRTDGTDTGTFALANVNAGNLTAVGDTLFFTVDAGLSDASDPNLWRSDGTIKGTVPVKAIYLADSSIEDIHDLLAWNNHLFFAATGPDIVHEQLWTSDGTDAGTFALPVIGKGAGSIVQVMSPIVGPDGVYYVGTTTSASTPDYLWKTDGRQTWRLGVVAGETLVRAGDYVYSVNTSSGSWSRSDGTAAGIVSIDEGFPGGEYQPYGFTGAANGTVFYVSADLESMFTTAYGDEIYVADGTSHRMLFDSIKGPEGGGSADFHPLGQGMLLDADDELFYSEGTLASTVLLDSGIISFTERVVGKSAYFLSTDTHGTMSLRRTDGTAAGTTTIATLGNYTSVDPFPPILVGNTIWFVLSTAAPYVQTLWRSDGTAAGTKAVGPLPTPDGNGWPIDTTVSGNQIYFSIADDNTPHKKQTLWRVQTDAPVVAPPAPASVAGFVFADTNHNGIRDAGESPLAGYTVFLDLNGDGILESTEPYTTTSTTGRCRFDSLAPGRYWIRVLSGKSQSTTTNPAYRVTAASGTITTRTFGIGGA